VELQIIDLVNNIRKYRKIIKYTEVSGPNYHPCNNLKGYYDHYNTVEVIITYKEVK
jgi:hypothetical protein